MASGAIPGPQAWGQGTLGEGSLSLACMGVLACLPTGDDGDSRVSALEELGESPGLPAGWRLGKRG